MSDILWSKVCDKLIKLSIVPEETVYNYQITSDNDCGDVTLNINTEKNKYVAKISVYGNKDKSDTSCCTSTVQQAAIILEGNLRFVINDLKIEEYELYKYEEINYDPDNDAERLKIILKALAHNHSKSIKMHGTKASKCFYSLSVNYPKNLRNNLCSFVKDKLHDELDVEVFKTGLNKLFYSGEKRLKADDQVYVKSNVLHSKIFVKSDDSATMKCRILNFGLKLNLPLVYDVLIAIFYFSTKERRQRHFHVLINYYYATLRDFLSQINVNILNILPREKYEGLIKEFSPLSKIEVILSKFKKFSKELITLERNSNSLQSFALELYDTLLYPNLSREDCYKVVRNKLKSNVYEFSNWNLVPVETRSGYLGDYYKLTINVKEINGSRTLNFFAKYLPTYNEAAKSLATVSFNKEEFFYEKFIKEVENFGLADIADFLPKCYFSRPHDVIILEDLAVMHYTSVPQGENLPYETLLLVIKQYAKLHACSLLYEENLSKKFGKLYRLDDEFQEFLKEALLVLDENGQPQKMMASGMEGVLKYLLDKFPDIPNNITMDEFKNRVKILFNRLVTDEFKSMKFRNVVCQGDPWGNNFLFQMDNNEKPNKCCIVDYQLIRYCPPSVDLMLFIYLNTDQNVRRKYLSLLLSEYYKEVSEIVRKHGYDMTNIFTYQEFLDSFTFAKDKVIPLATLYLHVILYPSEKFDKIKEDLEKFNYILTVDRKEMIDEANISGVYRTRIREIIEELYELCDNIF